MNRRAPGWLVITKKEYVENVRNAWIITVSLVFLCITLLTAWLIAALGFDGFAAGRAGAFERVVATLSAMQAFGGFLPPILALMLGFATLAGERESGSLGLLTAQPVSRTEIVIGKWLGLWGVLATAVLVGFGLGGLGVVARAGAGPEGYQALLVFLLATLAWGAAWTSITVLLSSFFARRGTAIAGSVGIWFLFGSFVWTILTFLLVSAATGNTPIQSLEDVPPWLVVTQLLNPNQVYDGLLTSSIEGFGIAMDLGGVGREALRELYQLTLFSAAMAAWIALPLAGAVALFRRRDI
ncbi:MAG TPA: ABC transporter permease subunit [Candidatus Thermoplasmatota archaeon]|nr:ABC transporter permease subunit [Candidatus Thermoplasmatota archaeon]